MQPTRPKSDSLEAMGLQAFMDHRYYRYGGMMKLKEMFQAGATNAEIAQHFHVERHAINRWRDRWQQEKEG